MTEVRRDEQSLNRIARFALLQGVCLCLLLSACAKITKDEPEPLGAHRLTLAADSRVIVAQSPSHIEEAAAAARRESRRIADFPRGSRRLESAAAALLTGSPEGLAFLLSPFPRAFVIGEPPQSCPARVAAVGGADEAASAAAAFEGCFAALRDAQAPESCGCRALAANDSLLADQQAFAYAPGVSGWLVSPGLGLDLHVPTREGATPTGERLLTAAAPPGFALAVEMRRDGTAAGVLLRRGEPPVELTGRHRPEGLRRGRFADRALLRDAEGHELRVLSGYEPVEYAVRRRELTRWTPDEG